MTFRILLYFSVTLQFFSFPLRPLFPTVPFNFLDGEPSPFQINSLESIQVCHLMHSLMVDTRMVVGMFWKSMCLFMCTNHTSNDNTHPILFKSWETLWLSSFVTYSGLSPTPITEVSWSVSHEVQRYVHLTTLPGFYCARTRANPPYYQKWYFLLVFRLKDLTWSKA